MLSLILTQIREVWNTYELDLVNYQNKCRLIRGWDDLFNKVKEHINSVSAMKLSPYYKVPLSAKLPPRSTLALRRRCRAFCQQLPEACSLKREPENWTRAPPACSVGRAASAWERKL